jgi:Putative MetA-pathway of phenol degradation
MRNANATGYEASLSKARSSAGSDGCAAAVVIARALVGGCILAVLTVWPNVAGAQDASSQDQNANTGNDLFRPPPNLFQMMYDYRTAPGSGSTPGSTRDVTTETLNLRMDHSLDLAPLWILALRADLPLLARNPITSSNPDSDYLSGVGDADVQAIIVHNLDQRWTVGFGARLIMPTGGDTFGSGKWRIMPEAGVRYALWEINSSSYFEPVVRYDVSFAGDPTRRNISNLQFAPTFNLGLPDRWFLTLYPTPDIRINLGDPITGQTGRLFLPFDVRIGRQLSSNVVLSLELGVPIIRDYPVYNLKTQVRLNVTY